MAFAMDRDLLVLEPRLFVDLVWIGQRRFAGTVATSGTVLIGAAADFEAAGVEAGGVMTVGGASYEVIERLSPTQLRVSLVRGSKAEDPRAPGGAGGLSGAGSVVSFGPQLELVHRQLLAMAGLEDASGVVNGSELVLVEALGALHLVYAAASAGSGRDSMAARAEMYCRRFAAERSRVRVAIDLDGDGRVDATRRLNASVVVRG